MRLVTLALSTLSVASFVSAQVFTSTLPWDEGNTLIVSRTIDADGDTLLQTISTIGDGGAAATTAPTTTGKKTATTTKKAAATATASSTETDANGVVLPASGTQLNYSQFSSLVASPLKSAYEATASSAAGQRVPSWSPSNALALSFGVAVVGGVVGAGFLL